MVALRGASEVAPKMASMEEGALGMRPGMASMMTLGGGHSLVVCTTVQRGHPTFQWWRLTAPYSRSWTTKSGPRTSMPILSLMKELMEEEAGPTHR